MPISVVAQQKLDGTGQACEYVDEPQYSVEWRVEEQSSVVVFVVGVLQGYGLVYCAYQQTVGHEDEQAGNEEHVVWGKPEQEWR